MSNPDPAPSDYPLGPVLELLQALGQLKHAMELASVRMEKRLGITAPQLLVVRCLGRYPGMNAGQLAGLLHLDPGTVSALLKRMEAKGLLERRKDPRDGRRASLGLTAAGRRLDKPSEGTTEEAAEQVLKTMAPDDIETAKRVLARLTTLLGSAEDAR